MSLAANPIPWYKRDLFQLLGLRRVRSNDPRPPAAWSPFGYWRGLILANTSARREAKAILFTELAEATRQGMPLDIALTHAAQTAEEANRPASSTGWKPGADTRHRALDIFVAIIMFPVAQLAYILFFLLGFRMIDVERIARYLARRLYEPVSAGLPLSQAMRRLNLDYEEAEIRLVEAGEQWGTLPAALKRLGEFQITQHRLTLQGSLVLYPLWLASILFGTLTFCLVVILPKFKDIYDQLGTSLPGLTRHLINTTMFAVVAPVGIFFTVIGSLVFLMAIFRGVMNGNRVTKIMVTIVVTASMWALLSITLEDGIPSGLFWWFWGALYGVAITVWTFMIAAGDAHHFTSPVSDEYVVWVNVLLVPVLLLVAPYVMGFMERLVLRWERLIKPVLFNLPLVGRAARAEIEARWLGALSLGIASGVPAPDALRSAGEVAAYRWKARSYKAAELVEGGMPVGQACVRAGVLRSSTNHHLALLDNRANYSDGLRSIAEDASASAFETIHRTGKVVEVLSIVLLGLLTGLFALAMYLPLFNIPQIVAPDDPPSHAYFQNRIRY